MTDYTINKGDCLWKIVKNQYEGKINSDKEILQAIDAIAKANDIENPNLIYTGHTLNLPSYESIFAKTEEDTLVEETDLYEELNAWVNDSNEKLLSNKANEVEMFDYVRSDVSYQDEEFMGVWTQGLSNLADANIKASDLDGDLAINYKEFVTQEIGSYEDMYEDASFEIDDETGDVKTYVMDPNSGKMVEDYSINELMKQNFDILDADKSENIEKTELMAYYAAMDAYDSSNASIDGRFQIKSFIDFEADSSTFKDRFSGALKILNANNN